MVQLLLPGRTARRPREEVDKLQEEIFNEEGTKLLKLIDNKIPHLLNTLRSQGIKIYIITRGYREINWQRARLLGLDKYISREEIIGSNTVKEEDISTKLPFIKEVIARAKVEPEHIVIVTNDALSTIIPSIREGLNSTFVMYKPQPYYYTEFFGSPNMRPAHLLLDTINSNIDLNSIKIYASMNISLLSNIISPS